MPLQDELTTLLESCRKCIETGHNLWRESQESVRATKNAVSASRALIEQSDRTIERLRMILDEAPQTSDKPLSPGPENLLELIAERTFEEELVKLDGKHFVNCDFQRCTLEYGGLPVILESTGFHGCRFRFTAEAALTVQFLETFELMLPDNRVSYTAVVPGTSQGQLPN